MPERLKAYWMPSLFTLLNLLGGFLALIAVLQGNFYAASWLIILSVLCDGMDGKIARWSTSESPFGVELDSLADLVSFGVAPAVLFLRAALGAWGIAGLFLAFLYLFCGAYRLARFNVIQAGDRTRGYIGLPIPVAAFTLSSFFLWHLTKNNTILECGAAVLAVFLSAMMVSTVHYDWPRLRFRSGGRKACVSVFFLAVLVLMALVPEQVLFPVFLAYSLSGLIRWSWHTLRSAGGGFSSFLSARQRSR
ncbi:CDP-diacylglycerol--serine O-phosphatidyltransferase [bacterium]|nr:CDP-diacylglycerol--serine O-phosphatidyltransferase [bacterium]